MTNRSLLIAVATFVLSADLLHAQEPVKYREFQLGSSIASVAALAGIPATEARVIQQRPALLQELEWRPRYSTKRSAAQTDPIDRALFAFYDDQLYRVIVDYDPYRTAGVTQDEIVARISEVYGVASMPAFKAGQNAPVLYGEPDRTLASWGSTEYAATLFRVSDRNAFRFVISSSRLAEQARLAVVEAARLDKIDAPLREIAKRQKETDDARAADEKTRRENLPGFRP